jgi:broad specificity phosphatase PhoE
MSNTRLLLIRHAEVEPRYQKVFGGRIDMDISEHGHRQAEALAAFLRHEAFDAIYASPMKRVQQTLAPFLNNGAPKPVILSDLREVDFGDWTGHGWDDIQPKFGVSAYDWLENLERDTIRNAESIKTYRGRVESCLLEVTSRHPGKTVALFCHGGVIRMILSILLRLPFPKTGEYDIEYASVTEVLLSSHKATIAQLNVTPWRASLKTPECEV